MRGPSLALVLFLCQLVPPFACGQSGTSSALTGLVMDASRAVVAGSTVTARDVNTGAVRTGQTDSSGRFLLAQLNPGTYQIEVMALGFAIQHSPPIVVAAGQTVTANFTLAPAGNSQTVEVNAPSAQMDLENPNTSTTLDAKTIANLPNPGQDLTYVAQFAQGALMNTAGSSNDAKAAGGYGNVEFNGLPATSNGYIVDGFDANDPFLGLNIGLSTNLVIGLDALQEATVNTNSYAVDQGRYGASQIDYFTKSGTNQFHGDVYEIWNGSLFNATDYFLHANDSPGNIATKPRSTVNQFGVSLGGPILRNKLFFFAHYEGIRIALPIVQRSTVPSSAYQRYVLQQLPLGGTDPVNGTTLPAQAAEVDFYRNMFGLYRNTAGTPTPVLSCPLDTNGALLPGTQTASNLFNGGGCANIRTQSLNNSDKEDLIVLKIDHTVNAKNTVGTSISRTPACRLPIPTRLTPSSTLTPRSRSGPASLATRTFSARISSTSSTPAQPGIQPLSSKQLPAGAADVPDRSRRRQLQRSFHHNRGQQSDLHARPQGDPVADQ